MIHPKVHTMSKAYLSLLNKPRDNNSLKFL